MRARPRTGTNFGNAKRPSKIQIPILPETWEGCATRQVVKHTVSKPGQWQYIETIARKARVKGVILTVTAKLVARSGWANE